MKKGKKKRTDGYRTQINCPGFAYSPRKRIARFTVYVGGGSTARRFKTIKDISKDDAFKEWKKFRDKVKASEQIVPSTLGEFVEEYFQKVTRRLKNKTKKSYSSQLRNHILPRFGSTRLDKITATEVNNFIDELEEKGLSSTSIRDTVAVLRAMIGHAVRRGKLDVQPVWLQVVLPKAEQPSLELSNEEHRRFVAAFDDFEAFRSRIEENRSTGTVAISDRYQGRPRKFGGGRDPNGEATAYHFQRFRAARPFFVVALETGMRKSDLLALRWSSIDFDDSWIKIVMGKTQKTVSIPVSNACHAALLECRNRPVVAEHVFVNDLGRPISWSSYQRYFSTAKDIAGIDRRLRFHDLRHSYASRLVSRHVPLKTVSEVLGHSTVRMTERYARPSDEAKRIIKSALDDDG